MRPERGNVPLRVGDLGIVPAPDLLQDPIDGARREAQPSRGVGLHLVKVESHQLLAPQPRGEQDKDNRPIAPGTAMRVDRYHSRRLPPAPAQAMEALQAITEILECADLIFVECPWLQRWQAKVADAFGGITRRKQMRRLGVYPGGTGRQGGQVVVNRRRCQALGDEGVLPGLHIAAQASRDSIVAVAFDKEGPKAVKVEGDLLRDGARAHARDRQLLVVAKPGVEAVRRRIGTGRHAGVPFVTCFCGDTGRVGSVVEADYTTVTTQKGHFLTWMDS